MELKNLIKEYGKYEKKYKLPSFKEINQAFEIEKIDKESEILLKVIRKIMVEKIVNSLGFVEMLLNPMNAPRMYHAYIKNIQEEDKKCIDKIYESFSEISTLSLEREVDYDEKKEAELIIQIFKVWNKMKPEFQKILKNLKDPSESKQKDRSYFG